ncbi:hypothetical protein DFAR_3760002 [Desulfarculales bacterium]
MINEVNKPAPGQPRGHSLSDVRGLARAVYTLDMVFLLQALSGAGLSAPDHRQEPRRHGTPDHQPDLLSPPITLCSELQGIRIGGPCIQPKRTPFAQASRG